jgi:hypothetical protein
MNVASITDAAMSQGLKLGFHTPDAGRIAAFVFRHKGLTGEFEPATASLI